MIIFAVGTPPDCGAINAFESTGWCTIRIFWVVKERRVKKRETLYDPHLSAAYPSCTGLLDVILAGLRDLDRHLLASRFPSFHEMSCLLVFSDVEAHPNISIHVLSTNTRCLLKHLIHVRGDVC